MSKYSEEFQELLDLAGEVVDYAEAIQSQTDGWRHSLGQSARDYRDDEYPEIDEPDRDDYWDTDRYEEEHSEWKDKEPEAPDEDDFDDEEEYADAYREWEDEHKDWESEEPQEDDEGYFMEDFYDEAREKWQEVENERAYYDDAADTLDSYGDDVERAADALADIVEDLHTACEKTPPDIDEVDRLLDAAQRAWEKLESENEYLSDEPFGDSPAQQIEEDIDSLGDALKKMRAIVDDIQNDTRYLVTALELQNAHRLYRPAIDLLQEYSRARTLGGKGRYPLGWGIVIGGNIREDEINVVWRKLGDIYDDLLLGFPRFPVTQREWNTAKEQYEKLREWFDGGFQKLIDKAEKLDTDQVDSATKKQIIDILTHDKSTVMEKLVRELRNIINKRPI